MKEIILTVVITILMILVIGSVKVIKDLEKDLKITLNMWKEEYEQKLWYKRMYKRESDNKFEIIDAVVRGDYTLGEKEKIKGRMRTPLKINGNKYYSKRS